MGKSMNVEEKFKILSNDYADLIVDGLMLQNIYATYSDVSYDSGSGVLIGFVDTGIDYRNGVLSEESR
jgi:hypothetical protein